MRIVNKMVERAAKNIDIFGFDLVKKRKKKKESSLLTDVISAPEKFKLEAYIENEEIVIRINKKERP